MKVFDLCCDRGHRFEGWFGSEPDFSAQLADGLLSCPMCESKVVHRLPSAARLNLGGSAAAAPTGTGPENHGEGNPGVGVAVERQRQLLHAFRQLLNQATDVGADFAEQARAMHEGDMTPAAIRGTASLTEVNALLEDGVDVLPLPNLPLFKEPLQ